MDGAADYNSKTETENVDKDVHLNKAAAATSPKLHETKQSLKKPSAGDEEMTEDSPIMGVLTPKSEADVEGSSVTESSIEKAIWERADHFRANSENITLAGVRRLLEEDLGLTKNALDPFKKFISQQIDQVLSPQKGAKSAKDIKKNSENSISKKTKVSRRDVSDPSGSESDEIEDEVKSRKEPPSRRNVKQVAPTKKRNISETELDGSGKQNKLVKRQKGEDNDSDADGSLSEDGSHSSVEKSAQRKDMSIRGYGKRVEHLKSVIKACGMSVAPSIYKKAKQVPDNKREAFIVKELEDILSREGLSKNPSEKDIKNCRKRKERARELEGIDMSNIISSSRRRSTFSFATPAKPDICAKKDKVSARENKSKDSNDKGHSDDNEQEGIEEKEDQKEEVKEEKEGEGDDEEGAEDEDDGEEEEEEEDDEEEEEEESDEFNEEDNEDSD